MMEIIMSLQEGRNRVHPEKDITAHAELDAIRNAGKQCLMQK
ncbi:hypothetical protein ACT7DF_18870 [Bacillus cereus]